MMSWIGAANNCYHVILSFENISTIPLSFSQRARVDTQQKYIWSETTAFFNPFLCIKIQCTNTHVDLNQMRESSSGRPFTKLSTDQSRKNHTAFVLTVLNSLSYADSRFTKARITIRNFICLNNAS